LSQIYASNKKNEKNESEDIKKKQVVDKKKLVLKEGKVYVLNNEKLRVEII